ncbi:LysR family transcriptional regulator [Oerskovia sp. M15]
MHRAGGVLAAADVLHLTPSAVSQQIARLEAEEGIQVLDRGPRGVTLTLRAASSPTPPNGSRRRWSRRARPSSR